MKLKVMADKSQNSIVDNFHRLYYQTDERTWKNTFWLGVSCQKCPLDLWVYQEIVFDLRPDVIIESGTGTGGSALFLASCCELIKNGRVITIDIEDQRVRPKHQRITYLSGSSTSEQIVKHLEQLINHTDKVIVILDSEHTKEHVLQELRIYSKLVTVDSFLIVEDSNVNGHPVMADFGPGPMEAITEFLKENENFIVDHTREKYYLTFNPCGYLKRCK